jgi:pimeloyl-ACP methyl ester carboxylesterase
VRLHVAEHGDPDLPALVLLHGGGAGGWMWRPQVQALSREFRLLVPDLPDHGQSADLPFTMGGAAELVADAIRERAPGGRAHVVGLSLGAQVTVELLARAPRVVDRAVVSSALLRPLPLVGALPETVWRLAFRATAPLNCSDAWIRLNMRSNGIPAAHLADMRATLATLRPDGFARMIAENQRYRLPEGVRAFPRPALVLAGASESAAMRGSARDLADALPDGTARLLRPPHRLSAAAAHNASLTMSDLYTRVVRAWLAGDPLPDELRPLDPLRLDAA